MLLLYVVVSITRPIVGSSLIVGNQRGQRMRVRAWARAWARAPRFIGDAPGLFYPSQGSPALFRLGQPRLPGPSSMGTGAIRPTRRVGVPFGRTPKGRGTFRSPIPQFNGSLRTPLSSWSGVQILHLC